MCHVAVLSIINLVLSKLTTLSYSTSIDIVKSLSEAADSAERETT